MTMMVLHQADPPHFKTKLRPYIHAHSVRGESQIQRNANREVETIAERLG